MAQDITLRVLKSIVERVDHGENNTAQRKVLLAFTGSNLKLRDRLEELRSLKAKGTAFSIAFSFMAERLVDMDYIVETLKPVKVYKEEDIFQLGDIVKKHSVLISPNISTNTLSKVAVGIIDSFIATLIWTYLYRGKPVYLDFTSVRNYLGSKPHNNKINALIEDHIKTIKDMGAVELIPDRYVEIVDKKGPASTPTVDKKVITERDLNGIGEGERLFLPRGAILTPLAKEKAKLLGLTLEIQK